MRPLKETEVGHKDILAGTLLYSPRMEKLPECVLPESIILRRHEGYIIIASEEKHFLGTVYDDNNKGKLRRDLMVMDPKDMIMYVNLFTSSEFEAVMKSGTRPNVI